MSALIAVAWPRVDAISLGVLCLAKHMTTLITITGPAIDAVRASYATPARAMAMALTATTSRFDCSTNAALRAYRQLAPCVPLKATVVRSPLEVPLRDFATSREFVVETFTVGAELDIGPVLASNLETIVPELVCHITVDLVDLLAPRCHGVRPPIACREGRAKLVVVRIADLVITVTAVDHCSRKAPNTVWGVLWAFLVIVKLFD